MKDSLHEEEICQTKERLPEGRRDSMEEETCQRKERQVIAEEAYELKKKFVEKKID